MTTQANRTCNLCSQPAPPSELTDVGDTEVCQACIDRYYTECGECGGYTRNSLMERRLDGAMLCHPCRYRRYVYSSPLDCYTRSDEAVSTVDTEEVASLAYAEGNWYLRRHTGEWYENEPEDREINDYSTDIFDIRDIPEPGKWTIANEFLGHWHEGFWYSNEYSPPARCSSFDGWYGVGYSGKRWRRVYHGSDMGGNIATEGIDADKPWWDDEAWNYNQHDPDREAARLLAEHCNPRRDISLNEEK